MILLSPAATLASAQETTIESLGYLSENYRSSQGRAVSDDGTVIVGIANSADNKLRGFRWSVEDGIQELRPADPNQDTEAIGLSGDGSIVVGRASGPPYLQERAVWWDSNGQFHDDLVPLNYHSSRANAVSGDGSTVVGRAAPTRDHSAHAFRFRAGDGPYDLGSFNGPGLSSAAFDMAYDGSIVVGNGGYGYQIDHAFLWTESTGLQDLGVVIGSSFAYGVSEDGGVVVGRGYYLYDDYAIRWTPEKGMHRLTHVGNSLGEGAALDVSGDGTLAGGWCEMPTGRSYSSRGLACIWKGEKPLSLWDFLENDCEVDLTGWTRFDDVDGISRDGSTLTGTGVYLGDQSAFRIVLSNHAPSVDDVEAIEVECAGDGAFASLSTAVRDDGRRVNIRWTIDGAIAFESTDVEPGTFVLEHDFPHGESLVEFEASDLDHVTKVSTTVTVRDTTAPTVTVTKNVVVPTLPGKDFAAKVALPEPEVFDLCDGDPTLTNDAPKRFPLGPTIVTWTATDAEGNFSTARQRVTVKDREAPRIETPETVRLLCDRGEVFATARLKPPAASDNVTSDPVVTANAGPRFRIGKTRVTWTARDEAGNVSKSSGLVIVENRAPLADAGERIVVEAKSERGVRVRLDGRQSFDRDEHDLRFHWKARGVAFSDPRSVRPVGSFPVGTTLATLTVVDEGGARDADRVQIVVRLANSEERPYGAQANRAFVQGASSAFLGAESGQISGRRLGAFERSQAAAAIGVAAGDRILWGEGGSSDEARREYATLRASQLSTGAAAARAWLEAYAEDGDDASCAAAIDALRGVGYLQADLISQ